MGIDVTTPSLLCLLKGTDAQDTQLLYPPITPVQKCGAVTEGSIR